ncbi:MAG: iron ABC transporter permease [Rikenellaceae bacterium]
MNRRITISFVAIAMVMVLLFGLNLVLGSVHIPFGDVVDLLLGRGDVNEVWRNIIFKTRMPQIITAIFAGAGLSISGLQMQSVFRNPLAGPSELGVSAGASLGVAIVILLSGKIVGGALSSMGLFSEFAISTAAMIGAGVVMMIIVAISQRVRGNVTLLIIGVMIGYIATAIIGVLKFFSTDEDVYGYVIWGLGSFSKVSSGSIVPFVAIMAVLIPLSFLLIKRLNVMLLGDQYAAALGLNVKESRRLVIVSASALTAIVTAYCGPIIFLGLAVPHLCRTIFATADHKVLMPAVTLVGALLAMLCNLVARMPGFEGALPINSVTALIGAPIVIYVLFERHAPKFN